MRDLRPYGCTVENCNQADETFTSVKDFLEHEVVSHGMPDFYLVDDFAKVAGKSIKCPFCGLQTTEDRGRHSRGKHVGQHMEEIAFMVVPKAYEDWEFYSEDSSGKQEDTCERPYICEQPGCEDPVGFALPQNLYRHEQEVHNEGYPGISFACRCFHKGCDLNEGLPFTRWETLIDHLYRSHDERPQTRGGKHHVCTNCGASFAHYKHLKRHHKNISHICPGCPRHFVTQSQLSIHQSCHPHRCDRVNYSTGKPCWTAFSRAYDLKRHEDTVHNAKKKKQKYRCKICTEEKIFPRMDALNRHMRVVHPTTVRRGRPRRKENYVPEKSADALDEEAVDQAVHQSNIITQENPPDHAE